MTSSGELRAKLFELSRLATELTMYTTNLISSYWEFESKQGKLNPSEQSEWQARFQEAAKVVETKRIEYERLADEVSSYLRQLGLKIDKAGYEEPEPD